MDYIQAFIVGGLICVVGQILIDKTQMSSARILVLFVVAGCVLGGLGLYEPLVLWGGAGATVPLPGFGYLMAEGVKSEIDAKGVSGIITGGLKAAAAGLTCAMLFGFCASLIFNPKEK